jgi:hypothetical protein
LLIVFDLTRPIPIMKNRSTKLPGTRRAPRPTQEHR